MRNFILLLILLAAAPLFSQPFGGGLGTESSPYEIYTKAHLEELADSVNAGNDYFEKYFVQKQDINEEVTKMIGNWIGLPGSTIFRGNYNGQNYRINLNIEGKNNWGTGLFPVIANATLTNITVTGKVKGIYAVGAIVGSNISSTTPGYKELPISVISQSVNYADVNGEDGVGGIIGSLNNNSIVNNCLNLGKIVGENFCTGGIVGCSGEVMGYQGPINIVISNSKNANYIKGSDYTSGIVGHLILTYGVGTHTVINCINTGVVIKGKGIADTKP